MKNTYYDYDLTGFSEKQVKQLKTEIEKLGFKEVYPEKGGGEDLAHQVIAYLTLHREEIAIGLMTNIISQLIFSAYSKVHEWYKNNSQNRPTDVQPIINFNVHYQKISKIQNVNININKDYSEKDIEAKIKNTKAEDVNNDIFEFEKEPPNKAN